MKCKENNIYISNRVETFHSKNCYLFSINDLMTLNIIKISNDKFMESSKCTQILQQIYSLFTLYYIFTSKNCHLFSINNSMTLNIIMINSRRGSVKKTIYINGEESTSSIVVSF